MRRRLLMALAASTLLAACGSGATDATISAAPSPAASSTPSTVPRPSPSPAASPSATPPPLPSPSTAPAPSPTPTQTPSPAPTAEPAPEPARPAEQVGVTIYDFGFDPTTRSIHAGDTVVWSQTGDINHTVSFGQTGPNSGSLKPGDRFSATFDTPGTYRYVCSFHSQMQGTIEVS